MADRAISALPTATSLTASDLFVLSQGNQAKNTTWQTILGYLATALDGHGGISSIAKTGTSGITDTYTITFADSTTTTFTVTNGKGISSITQKYAVSSSNSTAPSTWYDTLQTMTTTNKYLWSYLLIAYNDSTSASTTPSVIGVYGDTGQAWYVWIRYSGVEPTSDADIGTVPDDWIGVYSGTESNPSNLHYTDFDWFEIKGDTGETGSPATIVTQAVEYQEGTSGTVAPSGTWSTTVPSVTQGNFLWTRTTITFNSGSPVVSYSVTRMGVDGNGAVSTVNYQSPDGNGNVNVSAEDIPMSDNTSVQENITTLKSEVYDKVLYFDNMALTQQDTEGQILRIPASGTLDDISTDSVVLECEFNRPYFIKGRVAWQSFEGYMTFTGVNTITTNAFANVTIGKKKQ